MKGATLFSGIGAPECAMPEIDWRWCAEIAPFPSAVHAARFPNIPNLGDVEKIDAEKVERPDIIVFGSPCQDFSVAGQRLGLDGARGNLALIALGLVGKLKPEWIVFENVPGLLSSWSGAEDGPLSPGAEWESQENSDIAAFFGAVSELGYSGAWASLDAQYFDVAQRRERMFFVGHLGDWRRAAAVLLEPESLCGDSPPRREPGQRPAGTLSARTEGGGFPGTDEAADGYVVPVSEPIPILEAGARTGTSASDPRAGMGIGSVGDPMFTLQAGHQHAVAHALRGEGFDASEDGTGRGTPLVPVAFQGKASAHQSMNPGPVTPTSNVGKSDGICIAFSCKDHGADAGSAAPTLRAMGHDKSHANAGGQLAVAFGGGNTSGPIDVATARNAHAGPHGRQDFESETFVASVALRGRDGGATAEMGDDLAGTVRASQGGGDKPHVLYSIMPQNSGKDYKARETEVTQPLMAAGPTGGNQGGDYLISSMRVRRLTPRECERLQGFPDDFTNIIYRNKPAADGPRYKAIGNSMAMPVLRWILTRIQKENA